jgi:hypothetical protein
LRPVVRLSGLEKGGLFDGIAAMLAEFAHPVPQGSVGESILFSDFLLRTTVDKNGTQSLVTTMARLGGLAKKIQATAVIHDPSSLEMLIIFGTNQGTW